MINMVGRLPISGIASRRHAPTERVAIYSSGNNSFYFII